VGRNHHGEIMFRGNIVMKGYLKNPAATDEAFEGGWFHSGDLAVMEPDGYAKIKDRSRTSFISGGENISSIELEDVLYRHPACWESLSLPTRMRSGAKSRSRSWSSGKGRRRARRR